MKPWERGEIVPGPDALEHLRREEPFRALIDRIGPCRWDVRPPFHSLVRSIVYQSVSGASAAAVFGRLAADVGIDPAAVAAAPPERLRRSGLSWSKAATVQRVAELARDGGLEAVHALGDDEVAQRLLAIKGIGPWTVDMFAIFCLGRLDVWPVGDLAVRGMTETLYDVQGRAAVREVGERLRPYRSVAAWYLWRASSGGRASTGGATAAT